MDSSSTSPARRIFSAARKNYSPISPHRLDRFGLPARLAIADTAGTAWALSHFHRGPSTVVLPCGQEAEALAPLPIEALRLSPDTRTLLRRLGLKRIGMLIDKPRAPFAARFESELLKRLDQALGHAAEPFALIVSPPVYHSLRYLMEPIVTQEAIIVVTTRLMQDLVHALVRDDVGARTLRLALYRVDGKVTTIDIGLTLPTRDIAHITRLVNLKLERIAEAIETGCRLRGARARRDECRTHGIASDGNDFRFRRP